MNKQDRERVSRLYERGHLLVQYVNGLWKIFFIEENGKLNEYTQFLDEATLWDEATKGIYVSTDQILNTLKIKWEDLRNLQVDLAPRERAVFVWEGRRSWNNNTYTEH